MDYNESGTQTDDVPAEVPELSENSTPTSQIVVEVQELKEDIPGLENLPPETQEPVIELYKILEEGHQIINRYIEGTKHTENIPKALSIIDNNIPTEEERVVEISPEKQEYIEDTVRVVELCNKVVNIDIHNIDVKNQVGIYEVLEGYTSKYNLTEQASKWLQNVGVEEAREYYAKTPKATLRRIRDMVQKKEQTPELKSQIYLESLAKEILRDYTLGSKFAQNDTYNNTLMTLKTFCSETSITDENFLNTLDERTKEINQLYQEILVDEKCRDVISKKLPHINFQAPMFTLNNLDKRSSYHKEGPLLDTRDIFSSSMRKKINSASNALVNELKEKLRKVDEKLLTFSELLIPELNKIREKNKLAKEQYTKNLEAIERMLPSTRETINTHFFIDRVLESVVSKEMIEEEEKMLKQALQSKRLLYHGTYGRDDICIAIATGGLKSRKAQQKTQGWSYYATDKRGNTRNEESRREYTEFGADLLFFSPSLYGAYSNPKREQMGHFVVGIPEGIAKRNYSIGGSTRITSKSDEVVLLDRENPNDGCHIKPEDAYLFIGIEVFEKLKKVGGEEFEEKVRAIWGDRLIVSNMTPPESIENLNLPPVNHARLLPTSFPYLDEFGFSGRVKKIVYS